MNAHMHASFRARLGGNEILRMKAMFRQGTGSLTSVLEILGFQTTYGTANPC